MPKKYTPLEEEAMYQTYLVAGSKRKAAKIFGCSETKMSKIVESHQADPEHAAVRAEVAGRIAGMTSGKAVEIIKSIGPEELESGLIDIYDKTGVLIGKRAYGPSLVAKATAAGILLDKSEQQERYRQLLSQDSKSGELLVPTTIEGLIYGIVESVKSMRLMDPQYESKNPDLTTEAGKALQEVERIAATDQLSLDDFDGPNQA